MPKPALTPVEQQFKHLVQDGVMEQVDQQTMSPEEYRKSRGMPTIPAPPGGTIPRNTPGTGAPEKRVTPQQREQMIQDQQRDANDRYNARKAGMTVEEYRKGMGQ